MKNIIVLIICICVSITSFAKKSIVPTTILELYQPDKRINSIQKDINFWGSKMTESPDQNSYAIKLAGTYSQLFRLTSQIEDLKEAEALLQLTLEKPIINRGNVLRALAHNYIAQHRFCEALDLVLEAAEIGENKFANDKMLFDIYMELGDEEQAGIQLTKITNFNNFDYLIRRSKWEDAKGNLTEAIAYLEIAKRKAIASNNSTLIAWIYSNLGDYYGHNGEIEKSYNHFKETLKIDPANWYALKGIAWIAYANDKNIPLAERLIQMIQTKNSSPDLHLRLAQLAEYTSDRVAKDAAITAFQKSITEEAYGDMYNKHECLIAAEYTGKFKEAYTLANKEIMNRPTVESYDLLAWSLFLDGKIEASQRIAKTYILGQTSEPLILLHLAHIFYQEPAISSPILEELEGAYFELGPLKTQEIKNLNTKITMYKEKKDWNYQLIFRIPNPFWFLG